MQINPSLNGREPVNPTAEKWRPPPLPGGAKAASLSARIRRFLDLQAGSIWNDLRQDLLFAKGNVLDVGCGAQPMRALLSQETNYLGIDSADAKAHFGYEAPDTKYFTGGRWPVEDAWAALLLCTETLEHVPETLPFLREAYRCTRPGGKLLLTIPFSARWHFIPHDYWRFTPTSLTMLLAEVGFEKIEIYARGNQYTVACYKLMALLLPLVFPQGKSPLQTIAYRLTGLLFSPFLVLLAAIANLTLRGKGGNDCLGYTVRASRPAQAC